MSRPALRRTTRTTRRLVAVARDEQLGFLAAAIAYYAFVSVIPLVLVAVAVASALAGPAIAREVLALTSGILSPTAATLLEETLTRGAGRGGATVVGLVVLTWSALKVFRGLDIAFSRIYGVQRYRSFPGRLLNALIALVAIAAAVGVVVAASALLPAVDVVPGTPLATVWPIVVLPLVFLPMYYIFPDTKVTVREVIPGALFAGIGWTALGVVFSAYAASAGAFKLYGILGGVLLVLTWFYAGGLLLLTGAVVNTVLSGRRDRQLQQGSLRDAGQRRMSEPDDTDDEVDTVSEPVDYEDIAQIRRDLDRFEEEIEDRTVHRDELESDLKRYIRRRQRRGHARGWGPYLVLLYGTAMTLGAFYLLSGVWAVLAMLVIWLSTLGLYALMLIVGVTSTAIGLPGRIRDAISDFRD